MCVMILQLELLADSAVALLKISLEFGQCDNGIAFVRRFCVYTKPLVPVEISKISRFISSIQQQLRSGRMMLLLSRAELYHDARMPTLPFHLNARVLVYLQITTVA